MRGTKFYSNSPGLFLKKRGLEISGVGKFWMLQRGEELCLVGLLFMFAFSTAGQAQLAIDKNRIKRAAGDVMGITKISLPRIEAIERADLYFWTPDEAKAKAAGILVLVPGRNGNGRSFLVNAKWRTYARENRLILCGMSFSSNTWSAVESYSNAHYGSGEMLLAGIANYMGKEAGERVAMLMYGFSAGARFTASFVEGNSSRMVAWCAYAVGRWRDARVTESRPPGIVACGEWDAVSYHASLLYFQQGRKFEKPWVWLSLKETGHQGSADLDAFVKAFFKEKLIGFSKHAVFGAGDKRENQGNGFIERGVFRDIDSGEILSKKEAVALPIFSVVLPSSKKIQDYWLKIHHP